MKKHPHHSPCVYHRHGPWPRPRSPRPVLRAAGQAGKRPNIAPGCRRQGPAFYYLPLTISEQFGGYFKGRRPGRGRFPTLPAGRPARLAGRWSVAPPTWLSGAYEHTINMQSQRTSSSRLSCCRGRAPRRFAMGVSTKTMPHYKGRWRTSGARRIGCLGARIVHQHGGQPGASRAPAIKASDRELRLASARRLSALCGGCARGQIDAMSNTDPVMTMLEQKGDVKDHQRTPAHPQRHPRFVSAGRWPAACLYAAGRVRAEKNPNTCQALAQCHRARAQVAGRPPAPATSSRRWPEGLFAGATGRFVPGLLQQGPKRRSPPMASSPREGTKTALKANWRVSKPSVKPEKIQLGKTLYQRSFAPARPKGKDSRHDAVRSCRANRPA